MLNNFKYDIVIQIASLYIQKIVGMTWIDI